MIERRGMAWLLLGAAAVWPSALCTITAATATPYERALSASWCGAAPHAAAFFAHCPACWFGAAAIAMAGTVLLRSSKLPQALDY